MAGSAQIPAYVASGSDISRAGVSYADADGCEYVYLYVASACTAKTPYVWYTVDTSVRSLQTALASTGKICYVVVATETLTAAAWSKFQVGGKCKSVITGSVSVTQLNTVALSSSALADGGAVTITPDDFAICVSATGSGATADLYLLNREITPS